MSLTVVDLILSPLFFGRVNPIYNIENCCFFGSCIKLLIFNVLFS